MFGTLWGMMHKGVFVMIIVVGLLFAASVALWFAPSVPAGKALRDGAAIVMRSWNETFNPASDGFLTAEIDIQGATASGTAEEISVPTAGGDASGNVGEAAVVPPDTSASTTQEPLSSNIPPAACVVSTTSAAMAANPSRKIVLNEAAWMGALPAPGETAAKASNREWIELKNISGGAVDLSGWKLLDASGNIAVALGNSSGTMSSIPTGGFYVLARGEDAASELHADRSYTGALSNAGGGLFLFDSACLLSDMLDASTGWPGGDNVTKRTLERNADVGGWHTSVPVGGTPHTENSAVPPPGGTVSSGSGGGGGGSGGAVASVNNGATSTISPSSTDVFVSTTTFVASYAVSITVSGDGRGSVTSTPPGVNCGATCLWNFSGGNTVTLRATPDTASVFGGWSGACLGTDAICTIAASGSSSIAVAAAFHSLFIQTASSTSVTSTASSTSADTSTSTVPNPPPAATTTTAVAPRILIAAIQIAGASSTNDFVKLFNPGADAVNVNGWKLRKKASTGSDQSLRLFPDGSAIAPHGYFTWANSEGGFSGSLGADVSSTATLAADNSVALFNASGTMMDAVAWGAGVDPYVEGCPYPTDPPANQILRRIWSGGAIVDTGNNADDFTL